MFNLADILAQVQKNPGLEGMAKVYGLSAEQTKATMDALLPAFSMGMNRAVQSPLDVAGLFGTFAKAPDFAKMMENPMAAGPAMMQAGQEVMAKVFGSNDLTQAIAQQAASMSGVGQEATKQMMPVMASLLMSGLMKQAMDGKNPLGQLLAAAMSPFTGAQSQQPADPLGGMMGMFSSFMGGVPGAAKPAGGIPGLEQMAEFAKAMQAANPLLNGDLTRPPTGEATGTRSLGQQAADTWTATVGQLFEHGRGLQDQQLAQLEQLFDKFAPKPADEPKPQA
ncbi:DUF937 domain-containing protein [Phreatobacter aquaticus]|uniref:DUF937 domain-containing protein n=1 Tax=Phreatobacter aquaticus TaxID=2570229 RepID=A0A4D7QJW2_9HYPH|nr:DUF937 domain-containing protein [Phreatobacter aquaticus]QCK85999.1 DUF937 domain-containing protein [Phreatobacter aquaticus]